MQGVTGEKESLIKWLEYLRVERSLQNEWVDTTNLYIKFMQARGYLNVMQYERARICFKSTAAYSELIGQRGCASAPFWTGGCVMGTGRNSGSREDVGTGIDNGNSI